MNTVNELKYKGSYPIKMKRVHMGYDMNREGEECWEQRIFMYLGAIRLDITDYNARQVQLIVSKLELMGLTEERTNGST